MYLGRGTGHMDLGKGTMIFIGVHRLTEGCKNLGNVTEDLVNAGTKSVT